MNVRKLMRLVASLTGLLGLAMYSVPAHADDPTVNIPHSCQGGVALVPSASPLTIVSKWTMSTRGNTQAFANSASGIMTINGQPVAAVKSEVIQAFADAHPDGNADDGWRVQWTFATTSPAQGQSIVVTFQIVLAFAVADHELGPGQPIILPAGPLFPNPFTCTVTGT